MLFLWRDPLRAILGLFVKIAVIALAATIVESMPYRDMIILQSAWRSFLGHLLNTIEEMIEIDGNSLTIEDVVGVAIHNHPVKYSDWVL